MSKLIPEIKNRQQELISYWYAPFQKKKTKGQFVIFAQGRTGSNLLRTLLSSHPDIKMESEILLLL